MRREPKSKKFRQMHELKLRMTVPCLAVLHSSSASVAVIDLLLDTPIPRIRSNRCPAKADVTLSFFVAYQEAALPGRRYRRRLALVNSSFCAVEVSEKL